MALYPNTQDGKVSFFQSKINPWLKNPTEIGTTAVAVSALETLVVDAQKALATRNEAQSTARTSAAAADLAIDAMTKAGMDIVSAIRTKARTGGDEILLLAELPLPTPPSAKGAPGVPDAIKATLENNGALTLTWKCVNPVGSVGTSYMVWRRLEGERLTFLGVTGERKFIDASIPPGTILATYQIQGFRSTLSGPWAQFNVNFTTEVGGATRAAISPVTAKLAA